MPLSRISVARSASPVVTVVRLPCDKATAWLHRSEPGRKRAGCTSTGRARVPPVRRPSAASRIGRAVRDDVEAGRVERASHRHHARRPLLPIGSATAARRSGVPPATIREPCAPCTTGGAPMPACPRLP
jgi:hypothetical protein